VRITAAQRVENENRIRAAMDRLLRGEIPSGGSCDIKTLALAAGVDRTAFYGNRPYTHLRAEFEHRLKQMQQHIGESPDPKTAQIERLKSDVDKLKTRLEQANSTIEELADFRTQALARLAAQHDEIQRLRATSDADTKVTRLPPARQKVIGPC
jgi:septal ring factor EnvC (AmiA/AmiB activator)